MRAIECISVNECQPKLHIKIDFVGLLIHPNEVARGLQPLEQPNESLKWDLFFRSCFHIILVRH